MDKPLVYLALPHRNDLSAGTLMGVLNTGAGHRMTVQERSNSALALCFNTLWADALNNRDKGITHFAMLHCDIAPEPGWLETLLAEQKATGADIMSTVVPIKDGRGVTSTLLWCPKTNHTRRLTMKEVMKMPATFMEAEGAPGWKLLANTGCWVCDFTKPWVEQAHFRFQDRIVRQPNGQYQAFMMPEDWLFSLDAHRRGLKVACTRKVQVKHKGEMCYPNFVPWGEWDTDHEPGNGGELFQILTK